CLPPSMLRRAWKPALAATVPALGGAYWYYSREPKEETFDLSVPVKRNGRRERTTMTFPLLSQDATDARIRGNATAHTITRPGIVWHHTTASVASNDPIEDATAHQVVRRDEGDGDLLFFAVMDGHGGFWTSQLLSRVLIDAIALELSSLGKTVSDTWFGGVKSLWRRPQNKQDEDINLDASSRGLPPPATPMSSPLLVARALQKSFLSLDAELLAAPVRVLAAALAEDPDAKKGNASLKIPDLSKHPLALPAMLPSLSGSCALLTMIDTAHNNMYVASAGDCRAVAGVWEPEQGKWRVEVLTEDQTGRNPSEAERMRREHPADEAGDVIRNGRVLGGLEPTRAFGDARYKWSRTLQATLYRAFLEGGDQQARGPPTLLKTPPYVTARPVVTHRVLNLPKSDGAVTNAPALRFIVLATDGLWDELSSEDVVRLVGGHIGGLRGNVPKDSLSNLVPTVAGSGTVQGKDADHRRARTSEAWTFVDDNASAHLIRNAFGGADARSVREVLSIPSGLARSFRDDVSVTVVWWEQENESKYQVATLTVPPPDVKAKL
ncbi:unnamed protein product, partial [Mycena citricolor]